MTAQPPLPNEMNGDSYATPQWIKKIFDDWFDPCPFNPNYIVDGLKIEWQDKTYVNPPYSEPLKWVKKAISEAQKGKHIVMLLRSDTSTEVFRLCHEYGEVLFFARRIKFNGKTPNFGSMLVIFGGKQ